MSANTQVNETRREIVLPAEENQILFVLLGALVEAQIDNDLLKVLCWVLWGDGFATRWARVLVCQILEEENLMVLQDVEVEDIFRDWGVREYAGENVRFDLLGKLGGHFFSHELLE